MIIYGEKLEAHQLTPEEEGVVSDLFLKFLEEGSIEEDALARYRDQLLDDRLRAAFKDLVAMGEAMRNFMMPSTDS